MITFTRSRLGYDATTDRAATTTVTTITADAVQVRGRASQYARAGVVETDAPTLLVTPTTYGYKANTDDFLRPGDVTVWCGRSASVADVEPIAPDGIVILARVIVVMGAAAP